jgi:lipooligosaccharide transport system ATP-binding protein
VHKPPVIVLDEPTAGVDVELRQNLWEFIRRLNRDGHTIVLTTHYLEEAARLCDRLVIMDNGTFLVEGKPADLVRDKVGNEIVEMDNTPDVIACLTEMGIPYEIAGDQVQVATGASRELAKILLDRCKTSRVSTRPATLEDVFLKLTGRNLRE